MRRITDDEFIARVKSAIAIDRAEFPGNDMCLSRLVGMIAELLFPPSDGDLTHSAIMVAALAQRIATERSWEAYTRRVIPREKQARGNAS